MWTHPEALLSMARQHNDDLARQARSDSQADQAVLRRRQRRALARGK